MVIASNNKKEYKKKNLEIPAEKFKFEILLR